MSDRAATPTIDLSHPHRSSVARMVEAMSKPRKLALDSLPYADSLDPTTEENCEFLLGCIEDTAELNGVGSLLIENMVKEILRNHHQVAERFRAEKFAPIKDPIFILRIPGPRLDATRLARIRPVPGDCQIPPLPPPSAL